MSTPSSPTKADRGDPGGHAAASERPSRAPAQRPQSLVGQVLSGRYLIERLIGEGGMGAVYQAEHTHMRKRLAVKVLHPEMSRLSEVVARFEREAMAAAHIEHPNVAAATDFGKLEDGSFFLVLEYVEGKSLRAAIDEGRLELGRALHVARQIASALGRAHALGIVHRDLKPENVMLVARDGDPDFVKVLDFGIAKVPVGALSGETGAGGGGGAPGQALTQLGMVYGTPEYMAPEQALGQPVDPRADLYALGVIAFEMLAGARPFENESKVSLLGMHVTAPIPSLAERAPDAAVPAEVEAVVTRLLAKEAAARFQDARELVDAIDAVAVHLASTGRIADPVSPAARLSPRVSSGDYASASGPRSAVAGPPQARAAAAGADAAVAFSPTSLAQPAPPLFGPGAPPWLTPRILFIASGGLGALLLVLILAVSHSSAGNARPSSGGPGAGPASVRGGAQARRSTDEAIVSARAKIDKGDFATAIDELTPIESADPSSADVHALLERAYVGARNLLSAMREARQWLAADPGAASDPRLEEDVRNAALAPEAQDEAFALLESHMGAPGADLLYDIAYGASGRLYPQAATRARHSLDLAELRERASPALAVLLAFRDARGCDAKRALLADARDHADARMLTMLQPYRATRGCGFLGRSDCYPCMHEDRLLEDAIDAITARAAK